MPYMLTSFEPHGLAVKIVYSGIKLGNMQSRYTNQNSDKQNIQKLKSCIGKDLPLLEIDAIGGKSIQIIRADSNSISPKSIACDGLVTDSKNVVLGLYAADCIPMVITSANNAVLGLIHVGTNGANLGIQVDSVKIFFDVFGIKAEDLQIYLGPHIKRKSYVFKDISNKRLDVKKWHKYITEKDGLYLIDLTYFVVDSLINVGVKKGNISISCVDTYSNKNYYSHRRSKTTGEIEGRNGFMCALK